MPSDEMSDARACSRSTMLKRALHWTRSIAAFGWTPIIGHRHVSEKTFADWGDPNYNGVQNSSRLRVGV